MANPLISHKYTADPQPIVWRNRLYVYASFDDLNPRSFAYEIPAYTLMSTNDMANWIDHGEVFVGQRDWGRNPVYAPGAAVMRDSVFLYPCGAGGPSGVVRSATPYGPWNSPLGRGTALVDHNSCPNCRTVWAFDPGVFVDNDGTPYLYWGGGPHDGNPGPGQNIKGVRLNSDMISLFGGSNAQAHTIPAPFSFEAAYMHRHNNTYYFSYCTNFNTTGNIRGGSIEYMTSNNPLTGFTHRGTMLAPPGTFNSEWGGNNHHATIRYENQWYIFYHDRRAKVANNGAHNCLRSVSVARLTHNADGTIQPASMLDVVPRIRNFNPYDTIWAATMSRSSGRNIRTDTTNVRGRTTLSPLANNSFIRLRGVNFGTDGATRLTMRAANGGSAAGTIEMRRGNPTNGTILGTFNIPTASNWNMRDLEFTLTNANFRGVIDSLYLVFRGTASGNPARLFTLAHYQFHGGSVTPSHMVTVNGGTGGGSHPQGATVTITATVPAGQTFDRWTTTSAGVTFASATNATTTFIMPNNAVTVTATFRCPTVNPDGNGYYFHHTFEGTTTTQGWEGRFGPTVTNTATQAANGSRSLLVSGRTDTWQGALYILDACTFVPGSQYSFSGIAMYNEGQATSLFKLTLQYNLNGETIWAGIDSTVANRGQWVMLENPRFSIPTGATDLILYVEMPNNPTSSFYIDNMMGGVRDTPAPGRITTSTANARNNTRSTSPLITVRSKMLTVGASPETNVQVRIVDLSGKTVATINTRGGTTHSLSTIPAGTYIVEARRSGESGVVTRRMTVQK